MHKCMDSCRNSSIPARWPLEKQLQCGSQDSQGKSLKWYLWQKRAANKLWISPSRLLRFWPPSSPWWILPTFEIGWSLGCQPKSNKCLCRHWGSLVYNWFAFGHSLLNQDWKKKWMVIRKLILWKLFREKYIGSLLYYGDRNGDAGPVYRIRITGVIINGDKLLINF